MKDYIYLLLDKFGNANQKIRWPNWKNVQILKRQKKKYWKKKV